jgi:4-diphosphocytidyl-2-C-methyl-D-erythritol kinase
VALAPAKVNLYLDVKGPRPDGYHELATLFLALLWGDDVAARPSTVPGVRLAVEGDPSVPDGDENLAARAARAFLDAARKAGRTPPAGADLALVKRVPVGAGLGGGSSDAAAVLRELDRRAGPLDPEALLEAAKALGADVPFFLRGGAAIGRGRGDEIEPVAKPPPLEVVLVIPAWGHETKRVFTFVGRRIHAAPRDGLERAVEALASGIPERIRDAHFNALAVPAMAAYPEYLRFTSSVERALGRPPCMSGSGSALFDVPDPGETDDVLRRLEGLPARLVAVRA